LEEIQKRAEDTLKKISSGQATFEEMASTVSDDPTSSKVNGDIGFLPRNMDGPVGQQLLRVFGQDFVNAAFALKKGELSQVLTSNSGLHIIRVTQKIDKHFMTLDEPIFPGQQETVRGYIQRTISQNKLMQNQAKMVEEIGNGLRAKATVTVFEQNF
jgi:peptidyl-prolyl cis-trans isomerase D